MPLSRKRFDSIEITPENEHLSVLAVCTWSPMGRGLLQDLLDRWPSQKARTQRLILDALCQPPDDGRCLTKGRARLHRIAGCLRHPAQGRLDLPAFARQAQVCGQPCCLAQVADGLLALSIPRGKQRLRAQVGQAETPIGPETFPQSLHFCSRLPLIPTTQ